MDGKLKDSFAGQILATTSQSIFTPFSLTQFLAQPNAPQNNKSEISTQENAAQENTAPFFFIFFS
ncbi:MAG: hypothetical protein LBR56_03495 [Sporomusaceae bacterium]|jgi:hypothetical protein|nr:hypothetical protein [Sporomusaceae bacterium]